MCLFIYLAWEAVLLPTFVYTTWRTYQSLTASLETLKDTASAAEYRSQAQTKTREVMDVYIPQSRVRADRESIVLITCDPCSYDALFTGLIRTRKIWIVNMASIALISICVTAEQAYLCYRAGLANASAGGDNYRVFAWFSVSFAQQTITNTQSDYFAVALGHLWAFRQHHLFTRQLQEQKH